MRVYSIIFCALVVAVELDGKFPPKTAWPARMKHTSSIPYKPRLMIRHTVKRLLVELSIFESWFCRGAFYALVGVLSLDISGIEDEEILSLQKVSELEDQNHNNGGQCESNKLMAGSQHVGHSCHHRHSGDLVRVYGGDLHEARQRGQLDHASSPFPETSLIMKLV